ncbi:MAG: Rrf2 family transcriptional regulator [Nocardioidaceae bacterium]|nr:Rrf2 family transcriptional regulator [Nocardioidaceae bacterium]
MKLPESAEWVLHAAGSLAQLEPGGTASAARLAEHFDLPPAYLAKQLQALVRAGLFTATTGPRGGFRLARHPGDITLLEIVEAIDGTSPFYTCNEIRQQGRGAAPPEQCRQMCGLARHLHAAEDAWRARLAEVTLEDIVDGLPRGVQRRTRELLG